MSKVTIIITKAEAKGIEYQGGLGRVIAECVYDTLGENSSDYEEVMLTLEATKPTRVY